MNTAIIVAAGSGQRFGSDIPKQFLEIKGRTVLEWTIERFQAAPSVDSIILVLSGSQVGSFSAKTTAFSKVGNIVAGGASRAESVKNGLDAVSGECEVVAVHDGARPLISIVEIEKVIGTAASAGAACLVAPVTDTIKSIRGGEVAATLDREKLRRALTPQAFRRDVLVRAFELAGDEASKATDESYLVEKLGHPIVAVEGSSMNIKITLPEDLILAEALIGKAS